MSNTPTQAKVSPYKRLQQQCEEIYAAYQQTEQALQQRTAEASTLASGVEAVKREVADLKSKLSSSEKDAEKYKAEAQEWKRERTLTQGEKYSLENQLSEAHRHGKEQQRLIYALCYLSVGMAFCLGLCYGFNIR